ncbi:MAG: hypothetical protein EOP47_18125 [Sphingobacteriaceae bacterium]|nr:MAG: hypothetical protein EOP47_18125 [Sphingobacteriaceae bacterium]
MDKDDYILLYDKWLAGECSEEEKELLLQYRDHFEFKEYSWEEGMGEQDEVKHDIYNSLQQNMRTRRAFSFSNILRWSAAASIAIVVIAGIYKISRRPAEADKQKITANKHQVKPGGNKAMLNRCPPPCGIQIISACFYPG